MAVLLLGDAIRRAPQRWYTKADAEHVCIRGDVLLEQWSPAMLGTVVASMDRTTIVYKRRGHNFVLWVTDQPIPGYRVMKGTTGD